MAQFDNLDLFLRKFYILSELLRPSNELCKDRWANYVGQVIRATGRDPCRSFPFSALLEALSVSDDVLPPLPCLPLYPLTGVRKSIGLSASGDPVAIVAISWNRSGIGGYEHDALA